MGKCIRDHLCKGLWSKRSLMQEDWLGTPGSNCGLKRCYMKRRVEDTQSLQRYKNGRKSSQKTRTDILCLDESWETSYKVEEKSCGTRPDSDSDRNLFIVQRFCSFLAQPTNSSSNTLRHQVAPRGHATLQPSSRRATYRHSGRTRRAGRALSASFLPIQVVRAGI